MLWSAAAEVFMAVVIDGDVCVAVVETAGAWPTAEAMLLLNIGATAAGAVT